MKLTELKQLDEGLADILSWVKKKFKKKESLPDEPEMMQLFRKAGGYKRGLDVMGWQIGWLAHQAQPDADVLDAMNKMYYGGGSPFAFDEASFNLAFNARKKLKSDK